MPATGGDRHAPDRGGAALVAAGLVVVVRFEMFCLDDLAETPDVELQLFTRTGWLALILLCIPVGGVLYLCRGKA